MGRVITANKQKEAKMKTLKNGQKSIYEILEKKESWKSMAKKIQEFKTEIKKSYGDRSAAKREGPARNFLAG